MQDVTLSFEKGTLPLYEQLYRHIAGEIRAGRLAENTRLPSKRAMVEHLHISLNTVESAYQLLVSEGYVVSLPRRGYFVRKVQPLPAQAPPPALKRESPAPAAPRFDLSTSSVDSGLFPFKLWARLMRETLRDAPDLLKKGDARGDLSLRSTLSQFLYQYRGVRAEEDSLLVGAGVDYLLYVLFCLLPGGVTVAAEDPGYQGAYRLGQRHGANVIPLPMDDMGIRMDALEASGATVAFVTPSHQFPMGLTMPVGRRTALIEWARRHDAYIVEDDYDSEFRHLSRPIPALQGLGGQEHVVYIGTFSRSLAPSMRIAYMVLPPRLMDRWRALFQQGGDTVSRFEQQTLARFIAGGHYARHLRRAGSAYTRRCQALCAAIQKALPSARIRGAEAGLHFLVSCPPLSAEEMAARALKKGLHLHTLQEYCHTATPLPSTVLMGFAGLKDEDVPLVAQALREAWLTA